MKKILSMLVIMTLVAGMVGCGKTETPAPNAVDSMDTEQAGKEEVKEEAEPEEVAEEPVEEVADETATEDTSGEIVGDEGIPEGTFIPSNAFEERCGRDSFESYDEIVALLKAPEAYAYVDIMGMDEPVLLVADDTFGGDELGYRGALQATPYAKYADGKYHACSILYTISTGTPLAMSEDKMVYCATHDSMRVQCFGENGTDIPGIMVMKYVQAEYDDDGNPSKITGFVRDKNTVINNDGVEIAEDDVKAFKDAFAEYEKCTPIDFTVAE